MPRHMHGSGYLAIVVQGSFWEVNSSGRRWLEAGDVAVHAAFSAHSNMVGTADALVLNVPTHDDWSDGFARLPALDRALSARTAEPEAFTLLLQSSLQAVSAPRLDWPDELAADLVRAPSTSISQWGLSRGMVPETVSRGFARAYGVSPKRFRFEQKAHHAINLLWQGDLALAEVAVEAGFADQPSMTRAVRELTGLTPAAMRSWCRDAARPFER
jgi:AraC-like DNA-binding protein